MTNWLAFFMKAINVASSYLFDIEKMLTINLPIILIGTAFYIITFYLDQTRISESRPRSFTLKDVSNKEKVFFWVKMTAIIGIGTLQFLLALFLSAFLAFVAAKHVKNIGEHLEKGNRYKTLGTLFHWIFPIGLPAFGYTVGSYAGLLPASLTGTVDELGSAFLGFSINSTIMMIGGVLGLVVVLIAFFFFYFWGQNVASLSLEEHLRRYGWGFFQRIPIALKYLVIVLSILVPAMIIPALYIWNYALVDVTKAFFYEFADPNRIVMVNLPIILAARILYTMGFNWRYKRASRDNEAKNSNLNYTLRQRKYYILENVIMIVLGTAFIYFTLLFAVYSFLMAATFFGHLKKTSGKKTCQVLMFASVLLAGGSVVLAIIQYDAAVSAIPMSIIVGISNTVFFLKGMNTVGHSLEELKEKFNQRFTKKVPLRLRYAFVAYLVGGMVFSAGSYAFLGAGNKETFMVEMVSSDGSRLATDVYYAPGIGKAPAPVILIRTPYNKDLVFGDIYSITYGAKGFHVVVQDLRGCFASEGSQDSLIFTKSYIDGYDTVEWIYDQPWCNGKIGSVGVSAMAINSFYYAGMKPRGLVTQTLQMGTPDLYSVSIMEGAYHVGLVEDYVKFTAPDNWQYHLDYIYDHISAADWNTIEFNSTNLNNMPNTWSNISFPALHVGGWYDLFLNGTIKGFLGYENEGDVGANGTQRMILGPWTHGMTSGTTISGDISYPENSDGSSLIRTWEDEMFDEAFFGIPADWSGDRVAYYLMGDVDDPDVNANKWKYAPTWPLPATPNPWYFGYDNINDEHVLVDDGSGLNSNNLSYLYDPRVPVMTKGGNNLGFGIGGDSGPRDQRPVEEVSEGKLRDDVLVFMSEPLNEPYTIEGNLRAVLNIVSNVTDTDFMVKLCDVYPDDRRMLIIDSALMTRLRDDPISPVLMTPGTEYNLTVDLFATAYQFNKGHRIAVTVTSSNYPRYAVNPNTGGPITDHFTEGFIANNTIITGPGKSCIYLPELN